MNEATVHFKHVVNGSVQEMFICKGCAENGGLSVQGAIPITDFLFGVAAQPQKKQEEEERKCPACGMTIQHVRETSRLGCPECYEAFEDELRPMVEDAHQGLQHRGKVPARDKIYTELATLEDRLQKAVAEQNFEEAARLRDHVRDLRTSCGSEQSDGS
jgi:protein arginine kinase activator